jgi:hypothetical protein
VGAFAERAQDKAKKESSTRQTCSKITAVNIIFEAFQGPAMESYSIHRCGHVTAKPEKVWGRVAIAMLLPERGERVVV